MSVHASFAMFECNGAVHQDPVYASRGLLGRGEGGLVGNRGRVEDHEVGPRPVLLADEVRVVEAVLGAGDDLFLWARGDGSDVSHDLYALAKTPIAVISAWLGHSSKAFTIQTYVNPNSDALAIGADSLSRLLGG